MWVVRRDNALGDALLAATWTRNLVAAGVEACAALGHYRHLVTGIPLWDSRPRPYRALRDVRIPLQGKRTGEAPQILRAGDALVAQTQDRSAPYWQNETLLWRHIFRGDLGQPELLPDEQLFDGWYEDGAPDTPMLREVQWRFWEGTGVLVPIRFVSPELSFTPVPIERVKVALWPETGFFAPYRQWPHWQALYGLLDSAGVRWVNMLAAGLRDQAVLNQVYHASLYVGLETGVSHYVAPVAERALILQSGYSYGAYWAPYGQFTFMEARQPCGPCFLRDGCRRDHACMADISPEAVLAEILKLLAETA